MTFIVLLNTSLDQRDWLKGGPMIKPRFNIPLLHTVHNFLIGRFFPLEHDMGAAVPVFLQFLEGEHIQHAAGKPNIQFFILVAELPDTHRKFVKLLKDGEAALVKIPAAFRWNHPVGGTFKQAGIQFIFQMADGLAQPLGRNE